MTRVTNSSAPWGCPCCHYLTLLSTPCIIRTKKSPWSVCVRPWQRQCQHQRLREVHKTPVAMAARHGRPCPKGAHEHLCAEHINNSSLACSFEPLFVMRYPYIICCILFFSFFPYLRLIPSLLPPCSFALLPLAPCKLSKMWKEYKTLRLFNLKLKPLKFGL